VEEDPGPAVPLDCRNGLSAKEVKKAQKAWARHLGRQVEEEVEVADGVKMTFVLIPPGRFLMGSPKGEADRRSDEAPYEVTLRSPFYLARTEVTQEQYAALAGENPSTFKEAKRPVETVSWTKARQWLENWTAKRGDKHLYRLPTEAEWEYGCRGGRSSAQPFGVGDGRMLSSLAANFDGKFPYGGAAKGAFLQAPCPVASYAPNTFGLYDMHGNVWEWCADWYAIDPPGNATDPTGPPGGRVRVIRGGSWRDGAGSCRAAVRGGSLPAEWSKDLGFRVARSIPPRGK
jgi:formylglycine-generating enzyme required for sulfatase activity